MPLLKVAAPASSKATSKFEKKKGTKKRNLLANAASNNKKKKKKKPQKDVAKSLPAEGEEWEKFCDLHRVRLLETLPEDLKEDNATIMESLKVLWSNHKNEIDVESENQIVNDTKKTKLKANNIETKSRSDILLELLHYVKVIASHVQSMDNKKSSLQEQILPRTMTQEKVEAPIGKRKKKKKETPFSLFCSDEKWLSKAKALRKENKAIKSLKDALKILWEESGDEVHRTFEKRIRPRNGRSSYLIFQSLIREEIEAQFEAAKKEDNNLGNVDKFRFVTNQFSKRWRALTDQQKQVYSDLSSKEKEEATKKQVAWDHENQNREFNGEKKKLPPLDDSSTEEDL